MKTGLVVDWMSPDVITATPDMLLADAASLMREYDIRRLPVVDKEGVLIGIVTLGDIREASASDVDSLGIWELNYILAKLKVNQIMTHDPITVYSSDTIARAANLMLENKVSGLPVVDPVNNTLLGIITESDIFRLVTKIWQEAESSEFAWA